MNQVNVGSIPIGHLKGGRHPAEMRKTVLKTVGVSLNRFGVRVPGLPLDKETV